MTDEPAPHRDEQLPAPIDVVPHRPPFLFLDQVTHYDLHTARGWWQTSRDDWFFEGHFPGFPVLPGVLQTEAIAQLGAYAILLDVRAAAKLPMFGGLDRVKFRRPVLPGERLDLEVSLDRISTRAGRAHGSASVDGALTCECELLFVLADRPTDG